MPKLTKKMLADVKKLLGPLDNWQSHCHGASHAIVEAELFTCRVARGVCEGVSSQHSWVVLGKDCYDKNAPIIDATLCGYRDDVDGIWTGSLRDGLHHPHGQGSIWTWGRPVPGDGDPIELDPGDTPFSVDALAFFDALGPLDRMGWARLANAPVEDWPAAEIMPAINRTVGPLVPIDIIGMLTNENPSGLYLANGHEDEFAVEVPA